MKRLAPTIPLIFGIFIVGCGGEPGKKLSGKFLLSEHPKEAEAPDAIEFLPDGKCAIDAAEKAGITGRYQVDADGRLVIHADAGTPAQYTFEYKLLKYTLILSNDDSTPLFYVRWPEGSHPQFSEILGTFRYHSENGDSAGEITADRAFREHLHDFMPQDRSYYDVHIDGECIYSNGVVTYFPEHSDAPEQDIYVRDFVVKRDSNGLWQVDPFHDAIVCQPPATNLDLPPPPNGYRLVKNP